MNGDLVPTPEGLSADAVVADRAVITVLGRAVDAGGVEHLVLLELTGEGRTLSVRHYPPGLGTGRAMARRPDGGLLIAGETRQGPLDYRGRLLRLGAGGEVRHSAMFGPPGATGFSAVATLDDGTEVAGGTARGTGWLVTTGAEATLDDGGEATLDYVAEVTGVAPFDGGLAVVAVRERSTTALGKALVASLAANGQSRWQHRLPAGELVAVAVRPDGGLVATGHHEPAPARLWLVGLTAGGRLDWERSIGDGAGQWRGRAVAVLPGGGFAAAGDVGSGGHRELRACRLSPTGEVLWSRGYGGEFDVAGGIAAVEDGGLVLVGTAAPPPAIRVLRLDEGGDVRWERLVGFPAGPARGRGQASPDW